MSAIHPQATVDPDVILGPRTIIRQNASVTRGAILGADCSVAPGAMLDGCHFGDRCRIGPNVSMGPGFLVGDDVFIGPSVTFCNDAWPTTSREGWDIERLQSGEWAVVVEDGASIGANSVILPGVRIGSQAMIAAGSVVTRDVPAGHMWRREGFSQPYPERITRQRMRFAA